MWKEFSENVNSLHCKEFKLLALCVPAGSLVTKLEQQLLLFNTVVLNTSKLLIQGFFWGGEDKRREETP